MNDYHQPDDPFAAPQQTPGLFGVALDFETALTADDAKTRIKDNSTGFFRNMRAPLRSSFIGNRFVIFRNQWGRNSFRWCLLGSIEETARGTHVRARFGFHPAVLVIVAIWLAAPLFVLPAALADNADAGLGLPLMVLLVPGAILVVIAVFGALIDWGSRAFLVETLHELLGSAPYE